jgi:hypothetical protein
MALVDIKAQLLNGLFRDCGVNPLSIEFSDRVKLYRFEISFLLSFFEGIPEDDVPIERFTVLPERSGRKLQNPAAIESFLECAPGWGFRVVRLVDEKIRAVISHTILNGPLALACNAARHYNYLASAEELIDLRCGLRNVLKHSDYRQLGLLG